MKDQSKTKQALIQELVSLRQRIAELEQSESEHKWAEEALRESEDRYRSLFDNSIDAVLLTVPDGKIMAANPEACRIFGRTEEEICRIGRAGLIDPTDPRLAAALEERVRTGQFRGELTFIRKDGTSFPGEISTAIFRDYDGNSKTSMIIRDITERKRVEQALRESEERNRYLVQHAPTGIFEADFTAGKYLSVNDVMCQYTGYTREEFLSLNPIQLLAEESVEAFIQRHVKVLAGEPVPDNIEFKIKRKDGSEFWVILNTRYLYEPNNRIIATVIAHDITDRKQAENALAMSEHRFKELFENMSSSVGVYEATADGKDFILRNFNKAAEQAEQIDRKDVIGKSVIDVFPGVTNMGLFEVFQRVWSTGKPEHLPASFYRDKRIEGWRENYIYKLLTGEIVSIYNDITDRKKAEDTLRGSEARFAKIFNASPVAIAITRLKDNRLIDISSAWQKATGYSREEIIGRTPIELNTWVNPGERDQLISTLREQGTARNFPFQLRHKSGTVFEMLLTAEVIELAGEQYMLSLAQDITELKRAEEALLESETKYRGLYNSTQDGIAMANLKGHFIECNRAFLDMLGYTEKEIKGMTYQQTTPAKWHDMERNIVVNKILKTGYSNIYEKEYIRKDGTVFPVSMRVWATRDDTGKITGLWAIIRDITERKQAEEALRRAEENFRRSLDDSPLGVRIVTLEGDTIYANRVILDIYGYDSIEELRTTPLKKRYTPESFAEFQIRREKRKRGDHKPSEYDISIVRKDGEVRHLHVFRKEVLWNGERQFQVLYNDVTKRRRAEEALIQSEKKYRDIFEMTVEGIYRSTPAGRFIIVNPAFVRICGYASAEEMTEKVTDIANQLYASPEDRLRFQKLIAAKGEVKGFEVQFKHPTKGLAWISINSEALRDEHGNIQYYNGTIEDVTERKRAEEAIKASHQQLRALAGRLQSVREEQRKEIAREIHDELGGALTGLKIDLSFLASSAPKSRDKTKRDSFLSKILEMSKLIDETIGTVRRIVTELRPSILDDFGLLAALEWQLQEFQKRTGIQSEFVSTMEHINMDEELSIAVFRIFQEALTNVARHANATKVTATLYKEADSLVLKVEDNGKGISEDDIHNTKSIGLIGMRERALFLGGTVNFSGEPSKGTTVSVQFPFKS